MQVKFNPNVNQIRPNFKAKFSDDIHTKIIIETFSRKDFGPQEILAAHLALKDIDTEDKIKLYYENDLYDEKTLFAESSNGKKITLDGSMDLVCAISDKKLIDKAPNNEIVTYYIRANEILKKDTESELISINSLKKEVEILTKKLKGLQNILSVAERNLKTKQVNIIKEEIFSLAKKVK